MLPNLFEVRQQYQMSNARHPSCIQKSSIKTTEKHSEIQKNQVDIVPNTLLHLPSRWEIYREEYPDTVDDETALRSYLFSM